MSGLTSWRAAGSSLRHQGHEIFFREMGSGPALLLIHGFPTASWDWSRVWAALAQRFRTVACDMLGFGFSAKPRDARYSILGQADLQEALLGHLGIDRYHVIAHDYGDTVAQELLARQTAAHTPRLLSLVLTNGGLFPETHRPALIQRLLQSPLGPLVARLSTRAALARNLRRILGPETQPSEGEIDAFWELVERGGGRAVLPRLIRYMDERRDRRERWVGALTTTALPVRLVAGLLDPISGAHMVARYRELVPRPDVVELPRIGHYPQFEAPAALVAAVMAFHEGLSTFSDERGPRPSIASLA